MAHHGIKHCFYNRPKIKFKKETAVFRHTVLLKNQKKIKICRPRYDDVCRVKRQRGDLEPISHHSAFPSAHNLSSDRLRLGGFFSPWTVNLRVCTWIAFLWWATWSWKAPPIDTRLVQKSDEKKKERQKKKCMKKTHEIEKINNTYWVIIVWWVWM